MGFPLGETGHEDGTNTVNAPTVVLDSDRLSPRAPAAGLAPSLERRRLRLYLLQMFIDVVLLIGTSALVAVLYQGSGKLLNSMLGAQLMLPLFLTIAWHNGTYSLRSLTDWRASSLDMVAAVLIAAALLNFLAFLAKMNQDFSRVVFVVGVSLAIVSMAASRFAVTRWVRRHWGPTAINRLVIDAGGPPMEIPHAYRIDAAAHGLVPSMEDPHALDRLSRYLQNMDEVIVNCPLEQRGDWARALKGSGVHGEVTSDLVREIGVLGMIHREDVKVSTLLVSTGPLGMRARITKRAFDLAASLGALVVLSPVLLLAALAIKLEDGGPVLFRQRRLGRGNRFFWIVKLRTMRFEDGDAEGKRSTGRADDRVTRVGQFLRRTSIDELPQLLNVVKGEMSIVGPRPHALGSQAGDKLFWEVDTRYWQRHCLRPGMTGLAQIRGLRGSTDTEGDLSSRLQADLEYLAGWSIWRDISISFATLRVLVHDRAY
jgi:lipopolysaccharide/colanic/teichoic acid biosynthesis glycosyltransferase